MTREELHQRASILSKRLLSLPTFCREAIFPEGRIEVQRFFENLLLENEIAIRHEIVATLGQANEFWSEKFKKQRDRNKKVIKRLKGK